MNALKASIGTTILLASLAANAQAVNPNTPIKNARVKVGTCSGPDYPPEWLNAGETGTVQVALLVSEGGRVLDSKVVLSSGYARLDESAKVGFMACRFVPGTVDGVPTEMWTLMKFTFQDGH